jgi:hypothetical protein
MVVWGGAVHQPPALLGSKHQVVMIEQLRMAIMSEQALRSASSAEMIRPPCQVQGFFMGTKRKAPADPATLANRL